MNKPEKATDLIVFSKLREKGYVDGGFNPLQEDIKVWANRSSNSHIDQLLSNASKRQTGKAGYPEYIIFDEQEQLIVVIENKRDVNKHLFEDLDSRVDEYAVNGALWYAKFLKDSYNVIAVGISGTDSNTILIDTFAWRKESETFNNLNKKDLLKLTDYRDIFVTSSKERTLKQTVIELNDKSKEVNEFLRDILGVIEHERLYVLGAILYALEDPVFKVGYAQTNNNENLSYLIYQTVERKVKGSRVNDKEVIINELKPVILGLKDSEKEGAKEKYPNGSLLHLVSNIEDILLEFHKNREIDLMSTFFNVFLSYSTSGGSDLGIVLTPSHITNIFCDLAEVNINSKILDICVGTGGFLASAWRRIALDDQYSHSEKEIFRENNIIGVEKERSIYAIVALNMFINRDGRSNLYLGDAFKRKKELIEHECNVGFINPPYSDSIYSEISFVELMLDSLLPGSIGVAVIPVNAVSSRTKKHSGLNEVKSRILQKNQLLASIQMPSNLFYPKGTETIILVFRTGQENLDETWMAKFDDAFELIKHQKTRTPTEKSEKARETLIEAYRNRESNDWAFSKRLYAEDQWVFTVHHDYTYEITKSDLQSTVNNYLSYLYSNNYY